MNLHHVEHVFMEGGDFMISSGIVTAEALNLIWVRFECIDEKNINATLEGYLSAHISSTLKFYEEGNNFMVGHYLGYFGLLLCPSVSSATFLQ